MAGRRSSAALSIVASQEIDGRPQAPSDLTLFQAGVWEPTVANEATDTFKTAALQQLLKEYCRHVSSAQLLTEKIDAFDSQWLDTDDGLDRYTRLVRTRDCETKALADKATKLRLTNQSRYTPGGSGDGGSEEFRGSEEALAKRGLAEQIAFKYDRAFA